MTGEALTVEEIERGWVEFSCREHGFLVAMTPKASVACRCGRTATRSVGGRAVDEAGRVTQAKPASSTRPARCLGWSALPVKKTSEVERLSAGTVWADEVSRSGASRPARCELEACDSLSVVGGLRTTPNPYKIQTPIRP